MGKSTIGGVGWSIGELTLDAIDALKRGDTVILHTDRCGCARWLDENRVPYVSLDALYENCEDFDAHADAVAQAVLKAGMDGNVTYAVSDVRDQSVPRLIKGARGDVRVIPGPPAEGALLALTQRETRLVAASEWEDFHPAARENCLIREIDTRELAAEIKLRLMDVYPEEWDVWLMQGGEAPVSIPLYTLDRGERFDHRTCALIPAFTSITELERYDFEHLNEIIRRLCAPNGCPWDRVQTHASLRTCLLEETYEVIDAIDEGDTDHLYDELGDLLMHVVLHAEIARRHGEFDMTDITTSICEKLIKRHTHIFGSDSAQNEEEVLHLWNRNKMAERNQNTRTETLQSVVRTLPAMLRAIKVLKRSADAGLEDRNVESALSRCEALIHQSWTDGDVETHFGELLLELAGVARLIQVDPEIALNKSVNQFIERFAAIEREIREKGAHLTDLDEETLRKYWHLVKL